MLTRSPGDAAARDPSPRDRRPLAAAPVPAPAFRLIYRSHSLILPRDREVEHGDIFRVSRRNNTAWV